MGSGAIAIEVLDLGSVRLPDWHPRATEQTCPIQGAAIRHPDGVILFDTGVAGDHPLVNDMYEPIVVPIADALAASGIDERDVVAIVNSHLHFDHCGQNRAFPSTPVWVQRAEHELIEAPMFTIPEWAHVDRSRMRLIEGDETIADGVQIVATPGHTPGHQSLLVVDGARTTVVAGQCCYTCAEFVADDPAIGDVYDESWLQFARESILRLHAFEPDVVHLAHDRSVWRRTT